MAKSDRDGWSKLLVLIRTSKEKDLKILAVSKGKTVSDLVREAIMELYGLNLSEDPQPENEDKSTD